MVGALHPSLAKKLDVSGPVYLFEISLESLLQGRIARFSELSKFPESRRDLALIVDEAVAYESLREIAEENAGKYLKQITLFDVYQGQGIEAGRKSIALGLTWQHPSRTLNEEEISTAVQSVLAALDSGAGATLRD